MSCGSDFIEENLSESLARANDYLSYNHVCREVIINDSETIVNFELGNI